jgi:hypothetical protein
MSNATAVKGLYGQAVFNGTGYPDEKTTLVLDVFNSNEKWKQVKIICDDYALMHLRDKLVNACRDRAKAHKLRAQQLEESP